VSSTGYPGLGDGACAGFARAVRAILRLDDRCDQRGSVSGTAALLKQLRASVPDDRDFHRFARLIAMADYLPDRKVTSEKV
jgi:hypothetical protein